MTATPSRAYALITPCRDEADYARVTLQSVADQSEPPAVWIIVDDGSQDETPSILAEFAQAYDFIKIIRRQPGTGRRVGPGVVEAFYAGYKAIQPHDYEYVCKLDLDLDLPPRYFEILMDRMEENPRIGTCSGKPYFPHPSTGKLTSEGIGDEVSAGMTKFYRRNCFQQIGGFVREVMWDGIDCHRCRMLGWIACSWDDDALRFRHLRPMGSSHIGLWTGRKRHGFGQYFMGTGFLYMLASAIFRLQRRPVVLGGVGMLWGYLDSFIRQAPRYDDPEFRTFLRHYQWQCLVKGKRVATERLNAQQGRYWSPAPRPETVDSPKPLLPR